MVVKFVQGSVRHFQESKTFLSKNASYSINITCLLYDTVCFLQDRILNYRKLKRNSISINEQTMFQKIFHDCNAA